ncbi:MAG: hypothetical protein M2R45_00428 [Verrucomicrobia subdivision 3 bacterium]|nr:hypothetical protein [Limisphaerales bacterium]MCS1413692.1 hypothetical protein [Limisphaerales bacterium]
MARKFSLSVAITERGHFLQCDRAFDGAEIRLIYELPTASRAFNVTARLMARKFRASAGQRELIGSFNVTARLMARKSDDQPSKTTQSCDPSM